MVEGYCQRKGLNYDTPPPGTMLAVFCLGNTEVEKHLVVTIEEHVSQGIYNSYIHVTSLTPFPPHTYIILYTHTQPILQEQEAVMCHL